MKKFASVLLTAITVISVTGVAFAKTKTRYTYVTPKAPVITASLKPCIQKYRSENYTGAMIDLEQLLKKEKNNIYAQYYLALCYTKLGYEPEAKAMYTDIVEKNANDTITHYSKRALACIEDPNSEACMPQTVKKQVETKQEEDDDITKFIYSGKRIHPAAADLIMKHRMDAKLQQDEYRNKQNEQLGPLSAAPTNEEIAYALDVLAKVGINPLGQGYMLSTTGLDYSNMSDYHFPANYGNSPDLEQMLLYSQLNQQNFNYGI